MKYIKYIAIALILFNAIWSLHNWSQTKELQYVKGIKELINYNSAALVINSSTLGKAYATSTDKDYLMEIRNTCWENQNIINQNENLIKKIEEIYQ